jgi:DNA-binding NtrC family response regulator
MRFFQNTVEDLIIGFGTPHTAKESWKKSPYDFIAKPFKLREIIDCVKRIEQQVRGRQLSPSTSRAWAIPVQAETCA